MKILVISDLYPPYQIGGYEINCRDSVDALTNRGHEVTVLTSTWGIERKAAQGKIHRLLDYDPSFLENRSNNYARKSIYLLHRFLQLRRVFVSRRNYQITRHMISKIEPDIVYLWHLGHLTVSPALAAQDTGIPACFRIEDYSLARIKQLVDTGGSSPKRLYRSLTFGKKDIQKLRMENLLFISEYVKSYYLQAGFSPVGMDVVPGGLPVHSLLDPINRLVVPFTSKDGMIRLIFSGRIEPEKGPDIAIRAVASLKAEFENPLVYLDIVGDGNPSFLDSLKQLANNLSVSDRVTFWGRLSQGEVLKRFQCSDALLFTSRWQEPFGRVVIEAMAQGLPVIAAQNGGIPEIINNFENGLLIEPSNPQELVNAIKMLLKDPALAASISHNAFVTVCSRFTLEQVIDKMEKYMFDVVKSRRVGMYVDLD